MNTEKSTSAYIRPEKISADMGGDGEVLDERLTEVLDLLETISFDGYKTVLDIGTGKAQIAKWFAKKGFQVTGTGLMVESYEINFEEEEFSNQIQIMECNVEKMPFEDNTFDIIIMSHILEHCYNQGVALQEVKRVLSKDGILCIFVPPHDDFVCAGHVSMGWNLGQLMYVLVTNGFSVKDGKFVQYGYNVSAVVKKNQFSLPQLRGDRGDIHILDSAGFLPLPVISKDGLNDNFFGRVRSINWNIKGLIAKENAGKSLFQKVLLFFLGMISEKFKHRLAVKLYGMSRLMALSSETKSLQSPN